MKRKFELKIDAQFVCKREEEYALSSVKQREQHIDSFPVSNADNKPEHSLPNESI